MSTRTIRRYSQAVKHYVVSEIEAGRLTIAEAQRRFGIRSNQTVYNWLKAFGKSTRTTHKVFVQMKHEQDPLTRREEEIRRLKAEKQALETALAQSRVEVLFLESLVRATEDHLGLEAGSLKKTAHPGHRASPRSNEALCREKRPGLCPEARFVAAAL
ncbi:transposase [Rhodocaloribacter sp.]